MSDSVREGGEAITPLVTPFSYEILKAADGKTIKLVLHLVTGQVELFIPNDFASHWGKDLIRNSTGIEIVQGNGRYTPPAGRG